MEKKKVYHQGVFVGEYEMTGDMLQDVVLVDKILAERGFSRQALPPHVAIFHQAYAFSKASTFLYQGVIRKPPDVTAVTPFVVNITFSIELYLKSLALKHDKRLHGHELGQLFKKLPSTGKSEIERALVERSHSQWAEGSNTVADLQKAARDLNTAFVDWRYLFENPSKALGIAFKPTIYLAEVLHCACQMQTSSSA